MHVIENCNERVRVKFDLKIGSRQLYLFIASIYLIYSKNQREIPRLTHSVRPARFAANFLTCLIKECETCAVHVHETLI